MFKKIVTISFCVALFFSCQTTEKQEEAKAHTAASASDSHLVASSSINLNQGAKWLVNAEMKPFVTAGQNLVETFISSKKTDYAGLAKELVLQNEQLVKSCTMKGNSHEELHKWLHPHLELVNALSKIKDAAQAEELVHQLQASYHTYSEYFE